MFGLLIHVKPYHDESLPGFLYRLAQANGLSGPLAIRLLRERAQHESSWHADSFPEKNAFWDSSAVELISPQTRPTPLWNIRRRRFCIQCLAEKPYWRAAWDLSLVTACRRHGIQLQDQCPHCGEHLQWGEHTVESCQNCSKFLATVGIESVAATPAEIWMTKELTQRMVGQSVHCDRHLRCLELQNLHELAFRFGCYASRPQAPKPKKIANSGALCATRPICIAAAETLDNWPNGFCRSLDQIRSARGDSSQWKLKVAFGPIYRDMYVGLANPCFQFVRNAFENYLQRHWHAPLAFRHRSLGSTTIQNHKWLPIDEVAVRVQLDPALLTRLAHSKQVPCKQHRYSSGRSGRVIELSAVEKISDALKSALTVEQTATLLGLTKSRVNELIKSNVLATWGGQPRPGSRWFVDHSSVIDLFSKGQDAPLLTELPQDHATVDYLLRHQFNKAREFTNLMTSISQNNIAVCGVRNKTRHIRSWVVDTRAIKSLSNKILKPAESGFTIAEVAMNLEVKQEVAYALVRHGLIKSRTTTAGKKAMQMVSHRALQAFRRQFVLGTELASTLKISPKALAVSLGRKGAFPIAGPSSAKYYCRQYVWRRSQRIMSLSLKAK